MYLHMSSLWRYPLKSMAGVSLPLMRVNSWGPDLDRRWMVVDSQRRFLTQRQLPTMCRLAASLTESGLRLQSLDDESLFFEVPEPSGTDRYLVAVWSTCGCASCQKPLIAKLIRSLRYWEGV